MVKFGYNGKWLNWQHGLANYGSVSWQNLDSGLSWLTAREIVVDAHDSSYLFQNFRICLLFFRVLMNGLMDGRGWIRGHLGLEWGHEDGGMVWIGHGGFCCKMYIG